MCSLTAVLTDGQRERETDRQTDMAKLINAFQNIILRHLKMYKNKCKVKNTMYFTSSLSSIIHRQKDRHDKIIKYLLYFFFRKQPKMERKSCVKLNKYMYLSVSYGLLISEEKWSCF
jgi:hypothetical protein